MLIETHPKRRYIDNTCKLHVAATTPPCRTPPAPLRRHIPRLRGLQEERGRGVNKPKGLLSCPGGPGDVLGSTMRAPAGGVVRACRL